MVIILISQVTQKGLGFFIIKIDIVKNFLEVYLINNVT
jgi:hypothetical protein